MSSIYKKVAMFFLICFVHAILAQESIGSGCVGEKVSNYKILNTSGKKIKSVEFEEALTGFIVYDDENDEMQIKDFYSENEIKFYPYANSVLIVCKKTSISWEASREFKNSFFGMSVCYKFSIKNNYDLKNVKALVYLKLRDKKYYEHIETVYFEKKVSDTQVVSKDFANPEYKEAEILTYMVVSSY